MLYYKKKSSYFFAFRFYNVEVSKIIIQQKDMFFKEISSTRKKHDLICGKVFDEGEDKFPDIGLVQLEDAETGEQLIIDSSNSLFKEEYRRQKKGVQDRLTQRFQRRGIDFFSFSTECDFIKNTKKLFFK